MEKILVTGANGYIGKHVIQEMQNQNLDFLSIDFKKGEQCDNFIQSNIFEDNNLYEKCGKPKKLLHLAWRDGFIHNSDAHMEDLSKHYIFLKHMIESGVKQICIMGSMHEVGYYEGAIDDNTPTNPMSQYAIAKNTLRQSMELYCKQKGVVFEWIRGFYIFGDDEGGNSIFSKLIEKHKNGGGLFPFTSGKNKYDFISIDELSKQIVAVIKQDKIVGIINCCSGKPISLSEQIEWYIKENNLNIGLQYGAYPERKYDSPSIWGDNTKIKKIMENDV